MEDRAMVASLDSNVHLLRMLKDNLCSNRPVDYDVEGSKHFENTFQGFH